MEKGNYHQIASFEKENWWYKGRRDLLQKLISFYAKNTNTILDAGCGVGSNYAVLSQYTNDITGIDVAIESLQYCSLLGYRQLTLSSITDFTSQQKYDVIICLDVLEHISDDKIAIRNLSSLLNNDGIIIFSVPANTSLWNNNDVFSHHFRRYEYYTFKNLLEQNGLSIIKFGFWNISLYLPAKVFYALQKFKKHRELYNNLDYIPSFMNLMLYGLLKMENWWFQQFPIPQGVSLIAICSKNFKKS